MRPFLEWQDFDLGQPIHVRELPQRRRFELSSDHAAARLDGPTRPTRSSSSIRRAMLAPQSHAIQTMSPSTPPSRSPHPRCSVEKASRSVSRLTARRA
jgi:hypothetical protein